MGIAKVSGAAHANIAEVSDLAKANIAEISDATADFVTYDSVVKSVPAGDYPSHPLSGTFIGGYRPVVAYAEDVDRVIVGWQEVQSPHEPMYRIGELDPDGSVTWGDPIELDGTNKGLIYDMAYNPNTGKIQVVFGREGSTNNVYETKGVSIEINSNKTSNQDTTQDISGNEMEYGNLAYDEDTASMYMAYRYKNNDECLVRQLLDDCSDLRSFDDTPWSATDAGYWPHITYAKSINRMLVVAKVDGDSVVNCGTMSSSDLNNQDVTWGTSGPYAFTTDSNIDNISIAWDENLDKGIIVYQGDSDYGKYATFSVNTSTNVVTVNSGGTSAGTFQSSAVHPKVIWNQNEGHFLVIYKDGSDSNKMNFRSVTLNGSDNNTEWGSIRNAANYTIAFHTYQNIYKAVYIPDGSKGIYFPVQRDHYGDIDAYRISAQGTDYNNSV